MIFDVLFLIILISFEITLIKMFFYHYILYIAQS